MDNHRLLVSEGIKVTSAYNYDVIMSCLFKHYDIIIYTAIVNTTIDSFIFFCQINQEMSHK